jgi:hypothetical protein
VKRPDPAIIPRRQRTATRGVKVLRKGANGVWHASALRGKTTVMLTVDGSGGVSAD